MSETTWIFRPSTSWLIWFSAYLHFDLFYTKKGGPNHESGSKSSSRVEISNTRTKQRSSFRQKGTQKWPIPGFGWRRRPTATGGHCIRNNEQQELFHTEDSGQATYWSGHEDAKLQSLEGNSGKRSSNQGSKRRKTSVERKVRECYQWKASGQCSKGDSCSFSHDPASGNRSGQRQEGQTSSLAPEAKSHIDGKIPSKSWGHRGRSPSRTRGKIPRRYFLRRKCTSP